jgi:hypothetical protein
MTVIDPRFPLLGNRPYVHSTSILNFLDDLFAVEREGPVDLRIISQVMPGARALIFDQAEAVAAANTPCAALAHIGLQTVVFVNPVASEVAERRPDGFEDMQPGLTQSDGMTTLGQSGSFRHTFWDRAVFGVKSHLTAYHRAAGVADGMDDAGQFLFSRMVCTRVSATHTLKFTTEIVIDNKWIRIGVHSGGQRLGYALAGRIPKEITPGVSTGQASQKPQNAVRS